MEENNPVISIKDLTIGYSNKIVLQNISFDIGQNDIVAILGLNGTGKSTLLRTISGLLPAIKGEICINGRNLQKHTSSELAKIIGIVLPGRGEVMQALTVYEILSIARSPYTGFMHRMDHINKEVITETINRLDIAHLIDRKMYQLSDGEAQKIFIAKVLVQESPIILLDEPTSHLDIQNKIEVFRLIKKLADKNKTIVFASHELDLAIQVADTCFLINRDGTFVFGTMDSLIKDDKFALFFNSESFKFNKHIRKFETNFLT